MKAYTLMHNIPGRRETLNSNCDAFPTFAMQSKNGLPAYGRRLLRTAVADKEGDEAGDRFHYLLLDSLKKDRETVVNEGLESAARQRENTANDSDGDEGRSIVLPSVLVRVAIMNTDVAADVNTDGQYI